MTPAHKILADLRDCLASVVAEYNAKPTDEGANEIRFLNQKLEFYEGKWIRKYQQQNAPKPEVGSAELIAGQKARMGISTIEAAQKHVGNCLCGLWNIDHIPYYERRLQEEITKEIDNRAAWRCE